MGETPEGMFYKKDGSIQVAVISCPEGPDRDRASDLERGQMLRYLMATEGVAVAIVDDPCLTAPELWANWNAALCKLAHGRTHFVLLTYVDGHVDDIQREVARYLSMCRGALAPTQSDVAVRPDLRGLRVVAMTFAEFQAWHNKAQCNPSSLGTEVASVSISDSIHTCMPTLQELEDRFVAIAEESGADLQVGQGWHLVQSSDGANQPRLMTVIDGIVLGSGAQTAAGDETSKTGGCNILDSDTEKTIDVQVRLRVVGLFVDEKVNLDEAGSVSIRHVLDLAHAQHGISYCVTREDGESFVSEFSCHQDKVFTSEWTGKSYPPGHYAIRAGDCGVLRLVWQYSVFDESGRQLSPNRIIPFECCTVDVGCTVVWQCVAICTHPTELCELLLDKKPYHCGIASARLRVAGLFFDEMVSFGGHHEISVHDMLEIAQEQHCLAHSTTERHGMSVVCELSCRRDEAFTSADTGQSHPPGHYTLREQSVGSLEFAWQYSVFDESGRKVAPSKDVPFGYCMVRAGYTVLWHCIAVCANDNLPVQGTSDQDSSLYKGLADGPDEEELREAPLLSEEEMQILRCDPAKAIRDCLGSRLPLTDDEIEDLSDAVEEAMEESTKIDALARTLEKTLAAYRSHKEFSWVQSVADSVATVFEQLHPAHAGSLLLVCGPADSWVHEATDAAITSDKVKRRLNQHFRRYSWNYPSRAACVVRRLRMAGVGWLEAPEVLNYSRVLRAEPQGLRFLEELQRELERVEAGGPESAEVKHQINTVMIPSIRDKSPKFCNQWIARNRGVNGHHWLHEPLPDWSEVDLRRERLEKLAGILKGMEVFRLISYNRVFMRLEREAMGHIIDSWVKHPKDGTGLWNVFSIVLNLLRRQENWQDFLDVLNTHVSGKQDLSVLAEILSPKGLFFIVYQNSEDELQVKLLQDFALCHPIPLVMPKWGDPEMHLNSHVYHVIRESIGVMSFALGKEAAKPGSGKSELLNGIFGTHFTSNQSSFLDYGSIDLDTGASFSPDRKLAVADAHGRFDLNRFGRSLFGVFGHLVIHVNAQELADSAEMVLGDIKLLMEVLEYGLEARPWGGKRVVLLIRDAGYVFGQEFSTDMEKIKHQFLALHDFLNSEACFGTHIQAICIPDLRNDGRKTQPGAVGKISYEKLRCAILAPVSADCDALIMDTLEHANPGELGDLQALVMRMQAVESGKEEAAWHEPVHTSSLPQPLNVLEKRAFLNSAILNAEPSLFESYMAIDDLIEQLLAEMGKFADNYFQTDALPVRMALARIRELERRIHNTDDTKDSAAIAELEAESEAILEELKGSKPTHLMMLFLEILSSDHAITATNELGMRIRLQSEPHTAEERRQQQAIQGLRVSKDSSKEEREMQMKAKAWWLKELDSRIERHNFSIEVLFRELHFLCEYTQQYTFTLPNTLLPVFPMDVCREFALLGNPFELIDGDNLKFPKMAMSQVFKQVDSGRIFVVAVLGPQSSGKSTLLNFLFGCNFGTSTGRCTRGMYGTLVKIDHNSYDHVLILDTEGLQSPEKDDEEFDRKMSLFAMAVSNLVLINVKGEFNNHMKRLLEICVVSLKKLERARMTPPTIQFVFNQNTHKNKAPFRKQIEGMMHDIVAAQPDAHDVAQIMEARDEDLFVLGFAFNNQTLTKKEDQGQHRDWTIQTPSSPFAADVSQITGRLKQIMSQEYDKLRSEGIAAYLMHMQDWLDMAYDNWAAIDENPDLVRYQDLTHMAHDRELRDKLIKWENMQLREGVASYNKLVANLVGNLDSEKLCRDDYTSPKLAEMTRIVNELFDGKLQALLAELQETSSDRQYSRALVEQYEKKLCMCVDTYRDETMQKIRTAIQSMQAEQGRSSGQAELARRMQEIMREQGVVSKESAVLEFQKEWQAMIQKRARELQFEETEANLYEAMKAAYRSESSLMNAQVLNAGLLGNMAEQSRLREMAARDMSELAKYLSQNYMSSPQKIFQFARQPPHYLAAFSMSDAKSSLLQALSSTEYVNILNCFQPVCVRWAFDPSTLAEHVDWSTVREHLYWIFRPRSNKRDRTGQLEDFSRAFWWCGVRFESAFIQELHGLAEMCQYNARHWVCARLRGILASYRCFRVGRRFPVLQKEASGDMPAASDELRRELPGLVDMSCSGMQTHSSHRLDALGQQLIARYDCALDPNVMSRLRAILQEYNTFWNDKHKQVCQVLNEFTYFHETGDHPLKTDGLTYCDLQFEDLYKELGYGFLHEPGSFVCEYGVPLTPPDFAECPELDTHLVVLEGKQVRLDVRHGFAPYDLGLRYLNDHSRMDTKSQGLALKELQTLAALQLEEQGGWERVMEDLSSQIKSVIGLQDVNKESVSSYSSALVSNVSTKVFCFISEVLDESLGKFGVRLNMDGYSVLHFFALLQSWRLVANGQRVKAMKNIRAMEEEMDQYQEYFVNNVCANHAEASRNVANSFVARVVGRFSEHQRFAAAESVQLALRQLTDSFGACRVQRSLDEELLFRGMGSVEEVVKYITGQASYLEEWFNRRFVSEFQKVAAPEIERAQEALRAGLLEMRTALKELRDFLEATGRCETLSAQMFRDAPEMAVWEPGTESTQAFFLMCDYLSGQTIQHRSKMFLDFTSSKEVRLMNSFDKDCAPSPVPILFHFCEEALKKISTISPETAMQWGQDELEVHSVYQELRRECIGCPAECPTCGRKCDGAPNHAGQHSCSSGHQIRGMKGMRLENNMASVECCNEILDSRRVRVQRNGVWQSANWKKVKEEFPDWCYDSDAIAGDRIVKMQLAWNRVGKTICSHYNCMKGNPIKFTEYNVNAKEPVTHYILVLDESGSMAGERWRNARSAAMRFVREMDYTRGNRPSVIFFTDNWREIVHVGASASANAIAEAGMRGNGTSFGAALEGAISAIRKCTVKSLVFDRHVILHYTDGGAAFPAKETRALKHMQDSAWNICYYAISEQMRNPSLDAIAQQLHSDDPDKHVKNSIGPSMLSEALEEIMQI